MSIVLFGAGSGGGGNRPAVPTRDQILDYRCSFNGLKFNTPSYGLVYWWETIAWWPRLADRKKAYAAKRAAGDKHIILDLSGSYRELGDEYDQIGADYSQNLPALVALANEVLDEGFYIDLRLAGDGEGAGPGYNDPVGMTYGYQWLIDNFPRIADAWGDLWKYTIFTPGYDGCFYGWEPSAQKVPRYAQRVREFFPDAYVGLEFNTGHIPIGEGGVEYGPTNPSNPRAGAMLDYDIIFAEYDPAAYHSDSTWQINGRMARPYNRPSDQPVGDDTNPPFYLERSSPRGPWKFVPFEILTYRWVRGYVSDEEARDSKNYFLAMSPNNYPSYPGNI